MLQNYTMNTTYQSGMDDAAWEKHRTDLETMGRQECQDRYQSAYDCYMSRGT